MTQQERLRYLVEGLVAEYKEKQCHYKQFTKEKYFFLHACIPSVAYCKYFLQHSYFSIISDS